MVAGSNCVYIIGYTRLAARGGDVCITCIEDEGRDIGKAQESAIEHQGEQG